MIKEALVITRHPGLVEYLEKNELIDETSVVYSHAIPELVAGKHVIGVLPLSLAALCESFTEIPLILPPEKRGKELSVDDVAEYAGEPATYKVIKL